MSTRCRTAGQVSRRISTWDSSIIPAIGQDLCDADLGLVLGTAYLSYALAWSRRPVSRAPAPVAHRRIRTSYHLRSVPPSASATCDAFYPAAWSAEPQSFVPR